MPNTNETSALLQDLTARMNRLVEVAVRQGREDALAEVRSLVGGGEVKRGPGRPPKAATVGSASGMPKKRRKNSWAGLSPEKRLARVNAIRKGKGLPPKDKL